MRDITILLIGGWIIYELSRIGKALTFIFIALCRSNGDMTKEEVEYALKKYA